MRLLQRQFERLRKLWERDIWVAATVRDRSWRGKLFAVLRVLSITIFGLRDLKVAARAAALSYSSLLSLGPLVVIAVLISGFALGDRDPAILARGLNRVITFIAPQVAQFDEVDRKTAELRAAAQPGEADARNQTPPDPELVQLINNFIAQSKSSTAGAIGVLMLLLIVIQLFTSIENTFNDIWGVRRGRSWITRIVYYWTVITLGAVMFFTSLTLLSAGAFINVFDELLGRMPLGAQLGKLVEWLVPSASGLLIVLVLTVFYRTVPNTRVRWQAAFIGSLVVACLLFANNYVAFLYFKRVVLSKSLYGSVSILPVLMIGLYIFWFFVLVGGQITYAVQNVHYRSSQTAWHSINEATRESLSLLVLLLIARRFKECLPAVSTTELAHRIRVPAQILNESLNRLCDLGLVAQLPPDDDSGKTDYRYQPARPLGKITLVQFRKLFENYGEAPSGEMLDAVDPVLAHYHERIAESLSRSLGDRSLEELIEEFEPSATTSPFPPKTSNAG